MSTIVDTQALKQAHRRTWASGDYSRSAELVTDVGERIVERAGVSAGADVLDVAAGSGNAAIPAAMTGAQVIACDLTPELFDAGRRRAAQAGVEIEWIAADAEDLAFEDARFDYVLSSLGVQFARATRSSRASSYASAGPAGPSRWAIGPPTATSGGSGRRWGPICPRRPITPLRRRGGVASTMLNTC